jgi:hypothetical protein
MQNTGCNADLGDLIAAPERAQEVPAEMIPQLIGAVELQEARLERLKAELWACLLREKSDHTAVCSQASPRSKQLRAPDANDQRRQPIRGASSDVPKHNLMTVRQFCAAHPAFTEGSVRWLLFNRETNGLSVALVKKGRRIWIDVDAFFHWLEQSEPTPHLAVG